MTNYERNLPSRLDLAQARDRIQQLEERIDLLQKSRKRWIDAIAAAFPPSEEQPEIDALWNSADQARSHMQSMRAWYSMRAEKAEVRAKQVEDALKRIKSHADGERSGPGPRIGATNVHEGALNRLFRVIDDAVEKMETDRAR